MRLSHLACVDLLATERAMLVDHRDAQSIEIVIDGLSQRQEVVDEVAPAIRLHFRTRIVAIEAQLRQLGVEIDQ